MQHRREAEERSINDRWLRIQQKDAFYALTHLQNQLSTTQDSVVCFQSTLYGMHINDDVLLKIKCAVSKVTLAMDEMRLCFKSVGYNTGIPNHVFHAPQRTPPFTPTPRYMALPTIFQPINMHFMPNANQSGAPSDTPNYDGHVYGGRSYSRMPAQVHHAPQQPATPHHVQPSNALSGASFEPNPVALKPPNYCDGNESFESQSPPENIDSVKVLGPDGGDAQESHEQVCKEPEKPCEPIQEDDVADTTCVSDQTLELTLDATSGRTPDRETQSFLEQEPETYSGEVPEYVLDQTTDPVSSCEVPQEAPEHVYDDQISSKVPVDEASPIEYVPDQSSTPVPVDGGSYEALEYYCTETTEIPNSTCEGTPLEVPEELPDETSVEASTGEVAGRADQPANEVFYYFTETGDPVRLEGGIYVCSNNNLDAVAAEGEVPNSPAVVEANSDATADPYAETPESGLTPSRLSAIASAQLVESLLAEPAESSPAVPVPKPDSYGAVQSVEIMSNSLNKDIPFPSAKYRSGRESSHSNGSIDGFNSPAPSEARTVCNLKTSPHPCEVDELAKSLEEHWSLNDQSVASSAGKPPIVCIPKDGVLPARIEDYRMPPPLTYVGSLVSYCSDGSLFLQLMEDEKPILKLDEPIERGAKGRPLKFSEVQPGDFVLCLFDADNRFYRARLLKAKGEDKFEVRFIDYGNKCITSVKNMRRLPDDARGLGQCALKCELSDELRPKATEIIEKLERVSLESNFFACFAETYKARDSKSPIFTLIDIQMMDGSSLIQVPPPLTLEVSNTKFLVRNLVLGTLETAKIDFVGDLKRKEAIADLLKNIPSFPCEEGRVKEGTLVSYELQRARVTKVGPGDLVSLDLIDEFQIEPKNIPMKVCGSLPLAAINFPPAASFIVRVAKGQDIKMLRELSQSESDIEMTVVGEDVLPLVKFSKAFNSIPGESSDEC